MLNSWIFSGCAGVDELTTGSAVGAGITLTSAAAAMGSWVELSSAAPRDYAGLILPLSTGGNLSAGLIDIGLGAGGSEQVIINNFRFSGFTANRIAESVYFPIYVPKGQRIAARMQAPLASETVLVTLFGVRAGLTAIESFGASEDYGVDTANSKGTQVSKPASANTKGSWTEVCASLTNPCKELMVIIGDDGQASHNNNVLFDVAIGAASSEQIIAADIVVATDVGEKSTPTRVRIPVSLPAGTRISGRYSIHTVASTGEVDCSLQAFR